MTLQTLIDKVPLLLRNHVPNLEISTLVSHSNQAIEQSFFVALEEDPQKRAFHIREAVQKGAKIILCPVQDQTADFIADDTVHFLFSNLPRRDYALLAANFFSNPADSLVLIGVTGTNGKTTVSHLVKTLLEEYGVSGQVGLIGTIENKVGTEIQPATRTTPDPMELHRLFRSMVDNGCSHVVMEVSSHGLVQYRTAGLQYTVGIFTNLTQDHLDYHNSMEAYLEAKSLLFQQSEHGVFNLDNPSGVSLARKSACQVYSYSTTKSDCTLHPTDTIFSCDAVTFRCHQKALGNPSIQTSLPIPGSFSLENALAALTACLALGCSLEPLGEILPRVPPVKGRLEVVPTPSKYTVMIDYAHTPDALEHVLLTLKEITTGRLICLFGCGGNRDKTKRPIMGAIAERYADLVIVTSDNPRFENPSSIIEDIYPSFSTETLPESSIALENESPMNKRNKIIKIIPRGKAIYHALSLGEVGDTILFAGKGHECYQEVKGERFPMDERVLIQKYFENSPEKISK